MSKRKNRIKEVMEKKVCRDRKEKDRWVGGKDLQETEKTKAKC